MNILTLIAFIIACVFKYMTLPSNIDNKNQITLAIIFDTTFLACTVVYLLTVKMKSITLLVINWLLAIASLIARVILIMRFDTGMK
jgi:hypothetical protein